MHFYDFEVFKYDWMVVIIEPTTETITTIVNDKERLREYYEKHKHDIWVGFNSREYDQFILKGILLDMNPYELTNEIIGKGKRGNQVSSLFSKIQLYNYDVWDGMGKPGLKTLQAFMGHNIKETSVPFTINRKLTAEEIRQTIEYCTNDVKETINVFIKKQSDFNAHMGIIKIFNLPLKYINYTMAQMTADILGGKKLKYHPMKEYDYPLLPFVDRIKKYKYIVDWYRDAKASADEKIVNDYDEALYIVEHSTKKREIKNAQKFLDLYRADYYQLYRDIYYGQSLVTEVSGVKHTFKFGGLHGAKDKYKGEGIYLLADVCAYYPSMAIEYKFGYECMSKPENFELIHGENLRFKALGDKKARLPYKIGDNAITGQFKQKDSKIYCPHMNNAITINGQLALLLLIEMTEPYAELIQSNTDGVMWKLKSMKDFDIIDDIVYEWEKITSMRMEFSLYKRVFQKDVNNYVAVDFKGKMKTKGGYVKELNDIDYDLPIINTAIVEYMVNDTPIESTINKCNDLIQFQKIVNLTSAYEHVQHNGTIYTNKCYRVFASKNIYDGMIYKCKGEKADKFANTPDRCFIENGDITNKRVPTYLDKQYYIDLTYKRLNQFGAM